MGHRKKTDNVDIMNAKDLKDEKSLSDWTAEEVAQFLKDKDQDEIASIFLREKISGDIILKLTEEHLQNMGIHALGDRIRILDLICELKQHEKNSTKEIGKIIHDPIHGPVRIHPLCVSIIDTPEFQRLRHLKQLGCSSFVYPSGIHTRFEHSIGVYYLAQKLMQELKKNLEATSGEYISEEDTLCVSIAGLCHDLGHGPFSHLWEHFMELARPKRNWKHEEMSVIIFNRIWNKLNPEEKIKYNLNDSHRRFIVDLISGQQSSDDSRHHFLYQIVANKTTGIDVDKWDYVMRDSYYLGLKIPFDYQRLLQFSKIIPVNGENIICFKDSEAISLYQLFYMRWLLHRKAYKHRVSRIIERMLVDALLMADNDLTIGRFQNKRKLSEIVDDIDMYLKLNDSIYHLIQLQLPESHPSYKLIENIENRNIYKSVDEMLLSHPLQGQTQISMPTAKFEPIPDGFKNWKAYPQGSWSSGQTSFL